MFGKITQFKIVENKAEIVITVEWRANALDANPVHTDTVTYSLLDATVTNVLIRQRLKQRGYEVKAAYARYLQISADINASIGQNFNIENL